MRQGSSLSRPNTVPSSREARHWYGINSSIRRSHLGFDAFMRCTSAKVKWIQASVAVSNVSVRHLISVARFSRCRYRLDVIVSKLSNKTWAAPISLLAHVCRISTSPLIHQPRQQCPLRSRVNRDKLLWSRYFGNLHRRRWYFYSWLFYPCTIMALELPIMHSN